MKHIYIIFLTSLLFAQCKKNIDNEDCCLGSIKDNFVLSYATLDSLAFNVVYDNGAVSNVNTSIKNVRLEIKYIAAEVYSYNDTSILHKNTFKTYARLYKDTSFNKPVDLCFKGVPCMLDTISKIDLTCNRLYDDNHTSDMSLGDIVKITYCSAMDYINNNYSAQHDSLINVKTTTLKEFNMNYNYLVGMGASSFLSLLIPPKESGEYSFTLRIYIKDGRLFTYKFKPILLESKM
jgi:hypothetical protein